jgi:aspartyl-tRNA(Asn)/glutamyl-tRNA(Gln) amidotransferase subunit C
MISKEEVKHIAELARLGITEAEIEKMQKELSLILDYVKLLEEVDTSDVEPAFYTPYLKNVTREDIVKGCEKEQVEKIIEEFPSREGRYVKVKEVLSDESS